MRSFLLVSALVGCRPDLIVGTTSPPPGDTDPRQDGPDGGDSHDGGAEDGGSDDGGSAGGDDGSDGTDGGAGDGGDTGEPDPADRDGWVLVWRDEFDATELDRSLWDVEVNAWGGGNNELQYYTDRPENIRLEDGALIIEAHEESYTGAEGTRSYTSGRVRTRGNGDWTHGRFEARLKVPTGQGMWSAFWMLPTDDAYGGWAASGEIDVMELLGHQPDTVYGTLHYGGSWPNNTHTGAPFTSPSPYSDDFHEFAVEWTEDAFHWFVDGVLVQTQTTWYSDGGAFPAPFDQRFHILLNLAVGGDWPGSPDATTTFPQQLVVDHVRVYKPDDEDPTPETTTLTVDTSCTTEAPQPAATVALTGPEYGSWDPGAALAATDNGDGSWQVTIPTPSTSMEYLWIVNGVYEPLVDNMQAGAECAPVTDYSAYANRVWSPGDGDVSMAFGSCTPCP